MSMEQCSGGSMAATLYTSPLEWPAPPVDRALFLEQGYLILDCVPPKQLDGLRSSFEALVDRQRGQWTAEGSDAWETGAQPRLPAFDRLVDNEQTAHAMELCLGPATRGVCKELMQADEAANVAFFLMCSPQHDHGPAHWHRDIHPIDQGPLEGLRLDMLENEAPGYVQWNISLYDDNVLFVIPAAMLVPTPQRRTYSSPPTAKLRCRAASR